MALPHQRAPDPRAARRFERRPHVKTRITDKASEIVLRGILLGAVQFIARETFEALVRAKRCIQRSMAGRRRKRDQDA